MPITLEISKISLPRISPMALKRVVWMQAFKEEDLPFIKKLLQADLNNLVANWAALTPAELLTDVLKPLQDFFMDTQALPWPSVKAELNVYMRIFALVIKNRLAGLTADITAQLTVLLDEMIRVIGQVPVPNVEVKLPDELPAQFKKSAERWQKKLYKDPGRSSVTEPLSFITKFGIDGVKRACVRKHLIKIDLNPAAPLEALSYADAAFYRHGDLHADHLQSSEQIVERQKEMILAMNIDPLFANELFPVGTASPDFLRGTNGSIVGTKYFFMRYHNCIDNVWLISAAENSGSGKGNQDALQWLEKHERFGPAFLDSITPHLDKTTILYTVNGEMLAAVARKWFQTQYKAEIFLDAAIKARITRPMKAAMSAVAFDSARSPHEKKVGSLTVLATLALSEALVSAGAAASAKNKKHARADDPASDSVDTSDADITEKNLSSAKALIATEKVDSLLEDVVDEYRRTHSSVSKKRKGL